MKHIYFFNLMKRMALVVLLSMVVFGCAPKQPEYQVTSIVLEENVAEEAVNDSVQEAVVIEKGTPGEMPMKGGEPQMTTPNPMLKDKFAATLEVTENIKLGRSGTLKVWVGWLKYMQKANERMARDTTILYTSDMYARITPSADGCIIGPNTEEIIRVDSVGSEVSFNITPQEAGEYEVSARIEMFDNEECLGSPDRRNTTKVLYVKVKVDYLSEILNPVWKYFKPFWGALVALVFGAILFVVRNFIKKKTGYSDSKVEDVLEKATELIKEKREEPEVINEEPEVESETPDEEETKEASNEDEQETPPADE